MSPPRSGFTTTTAPATLRHPFLHQRSIPLRPGYVLETLQFDTASNLVAPGTFTWTVQFSNLGANQADFSLRPADRGIKLDDFWVNTAAHGHLSDRRRAQRFCGDSVATVQVVPLGLNSLSLTGGKRHVQSVRWNSPYQVQLRTISRDSAWVDFAPPSPTVRSTFPAPGGNRAFSAS